METRIEKRSGFNLHRLKFYNDCIYASIEELTEVFGKPIQTTGFKAYPFDYVETSVNGVAIVPFEIRVATIGNNNRDISNNPCFQLTGRYQNGIYTTNKDFSQRIAQKVRKCISEHRKAVREP